MTNNQESRAVVVVTEVGLKEPTPVIYELLALAAQLTGSSDSQTLVLVPGHDPLPVSQEIARSSGARVIAVQNRHLELYNGELTKKVLAELLPAINPAFILLAHNTQGLDLAPGLAVRLEAACLTGVDRLDKDGEQYRFYRPIFGGRIEAEVQALVKTTVLTIEPGSFKTQPYSGPAGQVDLLVSETTPVACRTIGLRGSRSQTSAITEADVIVAAGRGLGKKENLDYIERLAALFPRSAVAGSRPVCDLGWLDYQRQVGLTGATVSPKLYLACGISGARQHTIGMQGSAFIVAISTDPQASIFNLADLVIVEDLGTFLPTLINQIEQAIFNEK